MQQVIPDSARAVLDVWFKGADYKRWFGRDDAFDAELRARFGEDLARAARGELGHWCATPRGALAFVVLCDQLSRNCFRDSAEAFARDALALHTTLTGIARDEHRTLSTPERIFFLMPLMHSETLEVHDIARREFTRALEEAPEDQKPMARNTLDFEEKHRAVLERFGRYPMRNAALGRASTDAEIAYIKDSKTPF